MANSLIQDNLSCINKEIKVPDQLFHVVNILPGIKPLMIVKHFEVVVLMSIWQCLDCCYGNRRHDVL